MSYARVKGTQSVYPSCCRHCRLQTVDAVSAKSTTTRTMGHHSQQLFRHCVSIVNDYVDNGAPQSTTIQTLCQHSQRLRGKWGPIVNNYSGTVSAMVLPAWTPLQRTVTNYADTCFQEIYLHKRNQSACSNGSSFFNKRGRKSCNIVSLLSQDTILFYVLFILYDSNDVGHNLNTNHHSL